MKLVDEESLERFGIRWDHQVRTLREYVVQLYRNTLLSILNFISSDQQPSSPSDLLSFYGVTFLYLLSIRSEDNVYQ